MISVTPQAARDLLDIWNFIAQDNPRAARPGEAAVFGHVIFSQIPLLRGECERILTSLPFAFGLYIPTRTISSCTDPEKKPAQIIESSTVPATFLGSNLAISNLRVNLIEGALSVGKA